ncbi:MAG: HK97 gp10 family phage protein [Peptococcaceae bacterium]|nr:HK97 gp10 family phage protein [Peptococcaceae bacterium]
MAEEFLSLEEINKRLEDAIHTVIWDRLAEKMEDACGLLEAEGAREAPVDEGYLRAFIRSQVETNPQEITGWIGSFTEYAPYVHQGTGIYAVDGKGQKTPWAWHGESKKWAGWHFTVGQKPNPFLQRAIDKKRGELLFVFKDTLRGL